MAVSNHEGSYIDFPCIPGTFDTKYPKTTTGWLGGALPYSGVMAEAIKTVAITNKMASDNLLAIGYRGHAGYMRKFGGCDVTIDAVLTDNVLVSGAYGYQLSDFENMLSGNLTVITTNGTNGKKVTASGLFLNNITFTFTQNAECTLSTTYVGLGSRPENYSVAQSGAVGFRDFHCIDPLTWDEVHIFDGKNSVVLTGVQTATFAATLNRTEIFEIGQFDPYDRAVTHPYNVSVSLNTLANDVNLINWWSKFQTDYDPMADCATGLVITVRTAPNTGDGTAASRDFVIASGLRPTNSTMNVAIGSNSTVALTFEGTDLKW